MVLYGLMPSFEPYVTFSVQINLNVKSRLGRFLLEDII